MGAGVIRITTHALASMHLMRVMSVVSLESLTLVMAPAVPMHLEARMMTIVIRITTHALTSMHLMRVMSVPENARQRKLCCRALVVEKGLVLDFEIPCQFLSKCQFG